MEVNVDLSAGIVSAWPVEKTQDVLAWIFHERGHLTRIDLALDDRHAAVPLERIREAIEAGQLVTRAKSYGFTNRHNTSTGLLQGTTINIGSFESDTMLRIYDKRLELQEKRRQHWSEYGVRWELQLRKRRAHALGVHLASCVPSVWCESLIGVLRSFVDFRMTTKCATRSQRSRAPVVPWWQQHTQSFAKSQLMVEKPKEWGLADIKRILRPYMPNLATVLMCPGGRDWLEAEIQAGAARMKAKHHRVLDETRNEQKQGAKECVGVSQEATFAST